MKERIVGMLMVSVMLSSALFSGGCGQNAADDANTFSYFVSSADGVGTYYDDINDNPATQWLNQQKWDPETHALSENGDEVNFEFRAPVGGDEGDYYNTMMGTGDYPDVMDLVMETSTDALIEEGVLMDITEYVESYMPDYVALLNEHPDWKKQAVTVDEDGNEHYYWLLSLGDSPADPWNAFAYRRDWIVEYAEPTEYVWDWESSYVRENGHPAVTPLSEAIARGNLEGWKVNEITEFTSSEGNDPNNDYTDNVIFPSGTDEPLYISDWEWMLEAFQRALEDRGYTEDSNAYGISVYYNGIDPFGELVSSFGGGTGTYYIDREGRVVYSGVTDNFKAYIECLAAWEDNGWLDSAFETRSNDMFFLINETGYMQGKVGMWSSTAAMLGTTIRASCQDERDRQKAYVMGCALPINDVYGGDGQKFKEPDALCQTAMGPNGKVGVTVNAEGKDLEALFTCFNWLYTREGAEFASFGLTKEQYENAEFSPDVYGEYNLTNGAYEKTVDENGKTLYRILITPDTGLDGGAFRNIRMINRLQLNGHGDVDYSIDWGYDKVTQEGKDAHDRYINTGSITTYTGMLSEEEQSEADKINTPLYDYTSQEIPKLIKEGLSGWDAYLKGMEQFDVEKVCEYYQPYVDQVRESSGQ